MAQPQCIARIAICSFRSTPSSAAASKSNPNPLGRISALPLPLPLRRKLSNNRTRTRRPLVAVAARYGGGSYREDSDDDDDEYDADAEAGVDPVLDLGRVESSIVRLLDEQQKMVGVMSIDEAIQRAEDADMVLAILSVASNPPVLRLFKRSDYEKYKYEKQRKKKMQKRSAATRMGLKEIKMRYNIESHDYSLRLKAAEKFLKEGDKVKVIVYLKGRAANMFKNDAIKLIHRFQSDLRELANLEIENLKERKIYMILMPKKAVIQKFQQQSKDKEPVTEVSASV